MLYLYGINTFLFVYKIYIIPLLFDGYSRNCKMACINCMCPSSMKTSLLFHLLAVCYSTESVVLLLKNVFAPKIEMKWHSQYIFLHNVACFLQLCAGFLHNSVNAESSESARVWTNIRQRKIIRIERENNGKRAKNLNINNQ